MGVQARHVASSTYSTVCKYRNKLRFIANYLFYYIRLYNCSIKCELYLYEIGIDLDISVVKEYIV